MKKLLFLLISVNLIVSCGETIEERALRDAREYTRRYCPTPVINCTRTDSVAFDLARRTYIYYCSFVGRLDDADFIAANDKAMRQELRASLSTNAQVRAFIDAGIAFEYVVRSGSNPEKILFSETVKF